MACEVTYKGTKYSRNEFIELLYNGELDAILPKLDQRYFVGAYNTEPKQFSDAEPYNGIFSKITTGVKGLDDLLKDDGYFYFYKGRSGEIVMMSPDEYLKKVRTDITRSDTDLGIYDEKKERINNAIAKGDKINMPYLSILENGKAHSQEGRNRATIAKEIGEKLIPVFIEKEISFNDKIQKAKEYIDSAVKNGASNKKEVLDILSKNGLHRDAVRFIENNFDENEISDVVKEIDSVTKAEQRLKDAWNNFKNSGIATDKFEEVKREVELVKALFDYAWKKGLQTAKDVYDYVVGAISGISDAQAKNLSNKVESLLNNPKGLVDEVLGMYAPVISEQGLELEDVRQFVNDTFYKQGKFDNNAAQTWLQEETEGIDEQEKRLWTDIIAAAKQQEDTQAAPRPQPQAAPQPSQQAPPKQPEAEAQRNIEWANSVLGASLTKENFPTILFDEKNEGGVEKKRVSAETQEDVFSRKVEEDSSYISVTLQAISEVAQDDAKAALDKFGKNWVDDMLTIMESGKLNMSAIQRAVGLLGYISNDLNNKITSGSNSAAEQQKLLSLQRRADSLSMKFSSWASLTLNSRRILRKFAMGEFAMNDLSARVVGPDVAAMVEKTEQIMKEDESNEALNAATAPLPKARKKRSVVNRVASAIKPKSTKKAAPKATKQDRQNVINDAMVERRNQGMEGVSRQDLLNSIRERLNNCK